MGAVVDVTAALAGLAGQAGDPGWLMALAERVASDGSVDAASVVDAFSRRVTDASLVVPVLTHCGVVDAGGSLTAVAAVRLAAAAASVAAARDAGVPAALTVTVPPFMSAAWAKVSAGLSVRPTSVVVRDIAAGASTSLVLASPFLQQVVSPWVCASVERVCAGGGSVLVVTRALTGDGGGAVSAENRAVVADVRAAAHSGGGGVRVVSWEGPGLGMHCKVVAADQNVAYVGSANLTGPGSSSNAEAGVVVTGVVAAQLGVWVSALADSCTPFTEPA